MKFVLLVEGDTEKGAAAKFLKRWLDPQLKQPVGITVVRFGGYSKLTSKIVARAQEHLNGPRSAEIIAVLGLLDLYGPDFYPVHLKSAKERYDWGVAHFQKEVGHDRFRMFFAVHEFEAWLLSQPSIFPSEVRPVLQKLKDPERVNFDEPPGKLLNGVFEQHLKRSYKKTTYGPQLFAKLDPEIAVAKCPYLRHMLSEMLNLAKGAGL